ncbi:MAG: hypothetical protein AB7I04_17550 [Pseudomonadales bacterium]
MLTRKRTASSGAGGPRAEPDAVASRLLPMLLEGIENRGRIQVLDAGPGAQSTVDFFAGYNARIHFTDLLGCELLTDPPEAPDTRAAAEAFTRYLDLPDDLIFDVCLFWDTFHHIDLIALEGLSRALAPHVGPGTLGYGFGALHAGARAGDPTLNSGRGHYRYGILRGTHLLLRPGESGTRYHAHTQQQITEHFAALTIQRATLLQEGRLELLFARP